MNLARFLEALCSEGRVRVASACDRNGTPFIESAAELDEAVDVLTAFEREYRRELPGQPPELSRAVMLWAARSVYRACSLLAHRDVDAEAVRRTLAEPCPEPSSPSVCYGVDLTFRFLPDLIRLARAAAPDDPLVEILMSWARQWPLSSVGIVGVGIVDASGFIDDDCLRNLYVDRVIAACDESRLDDARLRDAICIAVGRHRELAPELAGRLDER